MKHSKRILSKKASSSNSLANNFKLSLLTTTLMLPIAIFSSPSYSATSDPNAILRQVQDIKQEVIGIEKRVDTKYTDISEIKGNVSASEELVSAAKNRISTMLSEVITNAKQANTSANNAKQSAGAAKKSATDALATSNQLAKTLKDTNALLAEEKKTYNQIVEKEKKIDKVHQNITNNLNTYKSVTDKNIIALKTSQKTQDDEIANLRSQSSTCKNEVTTLKNKFDSLQLKQYEIRDKTRSNTNAVVKYDTYIHILQGKVEELEKIAKNVTTNTDKIVENKKTSTDNSTKLQKQITKQTQDNKNTNNKLDDLSSRVDIVKGAVTKNTANIADNKQSSTDNATKLQQQITQNTTISKQNKTYIKNLQDKTKDLGQISKDVNTNKENITQNKKETDRKLGALDNKVATLEGDVTANKTNIAKNELAHKDNTEKLQAQITKQTNDKTATNNKLEDLEKKLEGKSDTKTVNSLQTKQNEIRDKIKENTDAVAQHTTDIKDLQSELKKKADTQTVNSLQTKQKEIEDQTTVNTSAIAQYTTDIQDLQYQTKDLGQISKDINTNKENIAKNKKASEDNADKLQQQITKQANDKKTTDNKFDAIEPKVDDLQTKQKEIDDQTTVNTSAIAKHADDIQDLQDKTNNVKQISKNVNTNKENIAKNKQASLDNAYKLQQQITKQANDKKATDNKFNTIEPKVDDLQTKQKEIDDQTTVNTSAIAKHADDIQDLQDKTNNVKQISKNVNTNKENIAKNKQASLDNAYKLQQQITKQANNKKTTDNKFDTIEPKVDDLQTKQKEIDDQTTVNTGTIAKHAKDIQDLKSTLDTTTKTANTNKENITQNKKTSTDNATKLQQQITKQDQDNKNTNKKVSDLTTKVDGLQTELKKKSNTDTVTQHGKDIKNLQDKTKDLEKISKDVTKNTATIAENKQAANAKVNTLSTKVDNLQTEVNKKPNTDAIKKLQSHIDKLNTQITNLKACCKNQQEHDKADDKNIAQNAATDKELQNAINELSKQVESLQAKTATPNNSANHHQNLVDTVKQQVAGTTLEQHAKQKFTDEQAQLDYEMPDSSNHDELASLRIDEKIMNNTVTRISSKYSSNVANVTGLSSGEIADNLEIWSSAGYQAINETALKTKEVDYDKLKAKVFSLGVDTMLSSNLLLGLSYGYADSDVTVYGSLTDVEKDKDNIKTNSVTAYIAKENSLLNTSVALMYANNKHKNQEDDNLAEYNSNVIELELDLNRSFALGNNANNTQQSAFTLGAKVNVADIHTDAHTTKYDIGNTDTKEADKNHHTFVTFGLGAAYTNNIKLSKHMQFSYKFGASYNNVILSGDSYQEVNILPGNSASKVIVKQRGPSKDNFVVDLACSLNMNQRVSLELSGNYSFGDSVRSYGGVAGLRFHF